LTARRSTSVHIDSPRGAFSAVVAAIGLILFLAGAAISAYDGVQWLRTGRSRPVLVERMVGRKLPPRLTRWLAHPGSWPGARDVVFWVLHVPLFAFALFLGFVILVVSRA